MNVFPTKFGRESTVISTYGANMGETKGVFHEKFEEFKEKTM